MNPFKKITHLIYDMDGLLLDTETLNAEVNQKIALRYGKIFDQSAKAKVAGRSTKESAQVVIELLELPISVEDYLEQRNSLIWKRYTTAKLLPGAMRLTQHFYSNQIPQAIATSSSEVNFNLKMTHHQDWISLFDCFVLGDDPEIQNGKPKPDIFLLAAQRLGASPETCLVFEDSLAGMQAAIAAGMSVVVIPDSEMDKTLYSEANQILNSLEEFDPTVWQLPTFI